MRRMSYEASEERLQTRMASFVTISITYNYCYSLAPLAELLFVRYLAGKPLCHRNRRGKA
jgi:hypothetical protein